MAPLNRDLEVRSESDIGPERTERQQREVPAHPSRPCHETDLAGIHCARPSRAPGTLGYLFQQLSDEGRL